MSRDSILIGGLIALVIVIAGLAIYGGIVEQRNWDQFAKENNCRPVAYKKSQTGTGVGNTFDAKGNVGIGMVTVTIPEQTCYACDDGKEYWR